jgi:excisionase family DNA binding protein
MIFLEVDRQLAAHVAAALHLLRESLALSGRPRPAGLVDLESAFLRVARGQSATDDDTERELVAAAAYGGQHELLTQRRAATMIGVSARTISRMIDRGDIPAVQVGGRRRVARAALEDFAGVSRDRAA